MKTIRYRYFSAKSAVKDGRKMSPVEWLIDKRSELTHVETQFDESRGDVSWSSTGADGANGCRFKYIQYSHIGYWTTLAFVVSDEEEARLWEFCCESADIAIDWQGKPYESCTLTAIIGQDSLTSRIKDLTIYQGSKHVKYDYVGLLTFALEKSPVWYANALRWGVWGWTVIIKPDKNKTWCSKACSLGYNSMKRNTTDIKTIDIDPGDAYSKMLELGGIKID